MVDAKGRALALVLTAGQVHDLKATPQLLDSLHDVTVVADKAYDCDGFAHQVSRRNSRVSAFPPNPIAATLCLFTPATTANDIGSRTSSSVSKLFAA